MENVSSQAHKGISRDVAKHPNAPSSSKRNWGGIVLTKIMFKSDEEGSSHNRITELPHLNSMRKLKELLANNDVLFLKDVLTSGGLHGLIDTYIRLVDQAKSIDQVVLLSECLSCIRAAMNCSTYGLEAFISSGEMVTKLLSGVSSSNSVIKTEIFELLSGLCIYSESGRLVVIQALLEYKELRNAKSAYKVLVEELFKSSTELRYSSIVLAFINCLLLANPVPIERMKIRKELNELGLQEAMSQIKLEDEQYSDEYRTQCEFYEEKSCEDEANYPELVDIDLSNPKELFECLLNQLKNTSAEQSLLECLQNLIQLSPKNPLFSTIWSTISKLTLAAVLVESQEEAERLLETGSKRLQLTKQQLNDSLSQDEPPVQDLNSNDKLGTISSPLKEISNGDHQATVISPPVPPPVPPPPPPGIPPPPVSSSKSTSSIHPHVKMKTFWWTKFSMNILQNKKSLWSNNKKTPNDLKLNYKHLEELFAATKNNYSPREHTFSTSGESQVDSCNGKHDEKLHLMDSRRCLNINIFLRQFDRSELLNIIRHGYTAGDVSIGAEKLKLLTTMLPDDSETEIFQTFPGDTSKLDGAEQFFMKLVHIPKFKERIEAIRLREELGDSLFWINPSINSIISSAKELMSSKPLREFLQLVLVIGNFINSDSHIGDAAGFSIFTLPKLSEFRANENKGSLLHFIIQEIEDKYPEILELPKSLSSLKASSGVSINTLISEVELLNTRVNKTAENLKTMPDDYQKSMEDFITNAHRSLQLVQDKLDKIEFLRKQCADYFGEDSTKFSLGDCFQTVQAFIDQFLQTRKELQKLKEAKRRKERKTIGCIRTEAGSNSSDAVLDHLVENIRTGFTTTPRSRKAIVGKASSSKTCPRSTSQGVRDSGVADCSNDSSPNATVRGASTDEIDGVKEASSLPKKHGRRSKSARRAKINYDWTSGEDRERLLDKLEVDGARAESVISSQECRLYRYKSNGALDCSTDSTVNKHCLIQEDRTMTRKERHAYQPRQNTRSNPPIEAEAKRTRPLDIPNSNAAFSSDFRKSLTCALSSRISPSVPDSGGVYERTATSRMILNKSTKQTFI